MKRFTSLLCAAALMGALGTACHDGDDPGEKVLPVSVSDEVASFFDENTWPIFATFKSHVTRSSFLVINHMGDLPKTDIRGNVFEYPEIDFNAYTMIFAAYPVPDATYDAADQYIVTGSEGTTIHVTIKESEGTFALEPGYTIKYLWGLYPKGPYFDPITITVAQN